MDVWNFLGGLVGGALSGTGLIALAGKSIQDRWMAKVKADYDAKLAAMQDVFQRGQKGLQALLDQGTHISKAQYDTEIAAYQDLWPSLSVVRIKARIILMPDIFSLAKDENDYNRKLRADSIAEFHTAHNEVVSRIERSAPFYPLHIRQAARLVTEADNELTRRLIDSVSAPIPAENNVIIQSSMDDVTIQVGIVEQLIRQRLSELRVVG